MIEDLEERRLQRAQARDEAADPARFAATACYAASRCQWDLGCPYLDSCHSAAAELIAGDPDWQRLTVLEGPGWAILERDYGD